MFGNCGLHNAYMEGLKGTQLATAAQRKGKVEPLLHIPLKNIVPDELHLMLQIN